MTTPARVIPHLVCKNAAAAIEFYRKAFGAEETYTLAAPDGKVMHAEITINGAPLMLADEYPDFDCLSPTSRGGASVTLHLDVANVDADYKRAIDAGAMALMEPADMFWGDRYGKLRDPFGHEWSLATQKEKLTPEQIKHRAQEAFAQYGEGCGCSEC